MAKKVVATLQDRKNKKIAKIVYPIPSKKEGYLSFKSQMISTDDVESFVKKLNI
jgi:hypothetical protein